MRVLIFIVAVVAIFAFAGWITFNREPGRSSINLETQEMREDTREAMHQGAEILQKAEQQVDPAESQTRPVDARD